MITQQPIPQITPPLVLQLRPILEMTDDQFFEFCQLNRDYCMERTAKGEIVFMTPTGSETGGSNFELIVELGKWTQQDGTGKGFDSSTGFSLPNGAIRSPDAAWVKKERWEQIDPELRKKFAPLCPEFVIELRSETDSLTLLQEKMEEYLENGTQLGWLIDRSQRKVYIYRPGYPVLELDQPDTVSADPELPGFVLRLEKIW